MNARCRFSLLLVVALSLTAFPAAAASTPKVAGKRRVASPFIVKGPQVFPSGLSTPKYGLFQCQVGLTPGDICYDPYQIRHAYNIDNLISAGFTGKGKTIVIVDAFQSPNIVDQLNQYDAFYGLPGLNGLGAPADPSLGTFTQIAPDGLTDFDPTDDEHGRVGGRKSRWMFFGPTPSRLAQTSSWSSPKPTTMPTS